MVFYRKYRPQTISDLDSSELRETLTAIFEHAFKTDQYSGPHAFLFTGPKGLGKTSTARIIAKIVNCTNRKEGSIEPCNKCDQCISITNGNNIDVLEIDGASNRGIDEIRDLRDKVKLAPSSAKIKVYIIDEVHMLTTEAFNALLKTIEEPPSHVMFIFATTEPQKVPVTIVSRCFHIQLKPATDKELKRSFERIIKEEKIVMKDDALSLLSKLSSGGFRDGIKILEEMVALSNGKEITKELIEEKYHAINLQSYVEELLNSLSQKDAKMGISVIEKVSSSGMEIKFFLQEILEILHSLLLEKIGLSEASELGKKYTLEDIQAISTLFSDCAKDIKFALLPQLPLEFAVAVWCHKDDKSGISKHEPGTSLPAGKTGDQEETVIASVAKQSQATDNTMDSLLKKEKILKVKAILDGSSQLKEQKVPDGKNLQRDLSQHDSANSTLMENIIYKVKPYNHSVAGVLRGCVISKLDDDQLIFQTAYKFHKERLDEKVTKEVLERILKEITGKSLRVMVELKG